MTGGARQPALDAIIANALLPRLKHVLPEALMFDDTPMVIARQMAEHIADALLAEGHIEQYWVGQHDHPGGNNPVQRVLVVPLATSEPSDA